MDLTVTKEQALAALKKGYNKAEEMLKDDAKITEFLSRLEEKLKVVPGIGEQLSHVPVFVSLLRSYHKKEYTKIPLGTIVAIISALIYWISPVDIIPDSIPGFGQVDDAAVLGVCLLLVDSDIKEYIVWRDSQK